MFDPTDDFFGVKIVHDTRLHTAAILQGTYSEQFYINMFYIAKYKIYLGYKKLNGWDCKMKGIKDFFYNRNYGLGIGDLQTFLGFAVRLAEKDETKQEYGRKFIEWLHKQGDEFKVAGALYEYRRVVREIRQRPYGPGRERTEIKRTDFARAKVIWHEAPHLLEDIGRGRKYRNVREALKKNGMLPSDKKMLRPMYLSEAPGKDELLGAAEGIYKRLGPIRTKMLIENLINIHRASESQDSA